MRKAQRSLVCLYSFFRGLVWANNWKNGLSRNMTSKQGLQFCCIKRTREMKMA